MMGAGAATGGRFARLSFWVAVAATFALLILLVGKPIPVVIWDEGRIIVSAMEMWQSGLSLVASYDFHPDLWNTKPPLLIWLMVGSIKLLGPSEFALRLPSLLAALGTLLLVMLFLRQISGSVATALFGGVVLASSVGFFGEHGARTADFDALLCFCTTAYLLLLFFALHRVRPPLPWLLLAGLAGAGALLAKGLAGGMPGAGFLLYMMVTGRWRRPLRTPLYLGAALLAVAPVLLFLVLREAAAPGYWHALIDNDVTGRFNNPGQVNNAGPPWYYLETTFLRGLFSLGVAVLLAPLALAIARGRVRLALVFALCIVAGQFVVVTASSTKLTHYFLSAYPFAAIAAALALHALFVWLRGSIAAGASSPRALWVARGVAGLALLLCVAQAIDARQNVLAPREHYPRTRYGALLGALAGKRAPILVVEPGVNIPDDRHYAPELRFYMMRARATGRVVDQAGTPDPIASAAPGTILATCDPWIRPMLEKSGGAILVERDGCVALRRSSVDQKASPIPK